MLKNVLLLGIPQAKMLTKYTIKRLKKISQVEMLSCMNIKKIQVNLKEKTPKRGWGLGKGGGVELGFKKIFFQTPKIQAKEAQI